MMSNAPLKYLRSLLPEEAWWAHSMQFLAQRAKKRDGRERVK